jgi:hypothetical protein
MFEMTMSRVAGWQQELSTALASSSGLDEAGLVAALRSLEELACTVSAAQAALSAGADHGVDRHPDRPGDRLPVPARPPGRRP